MSHVSGDVAFQGARNASQRILLVVGLFSCLINLLLLVGPTYMLQVYDRVLSSGSVPTLVYLTLVAIGLILISALLEWVRARILVRLSGKLDALLSGPLYDGLIARTLLTGDQRAGPLRDADTVRGLLTGPALFFFFDAPWTPIFLFVVALLHPLLFAVAASGALVLFAIAITNEFVTRAALSRASAADAAAIRFAEDMLRHAESVDAMGMLPGLRQRWGQRNLAALHHQAKASDRAAVLTALSKFVRPALQVAILGAGAVLVLRQEISAGAMVAASIIMGRALAPVEGAINNWRNLVLARHAYTRLHEHFARSGRDVSQQPLRASTGRVSVERLVMAPRGSRSPVLKGISFTIDAGELVGIVGPSASGKSTLARGLVGVWSPASGAVRLDGIDVARWNPQERGAHLGYLPQDIDLLEGTVGENIARFQSAGGDAVIEAAMRAGVHDMILRLPEGYDTVVGPGGLVLSGGQRQRIGLARALFGEPRFVVLDEPNANLDHAGEQALGDVLLKLKADGTTVVLITHRPSLVAAADRLLVLRDGMIEHYDAPANAIEGNITQLNAERQPARLLSRLANVRALEA